jgi:hypothetical protein
MGGQASNEEFEEQDRKFDPATCDYGGQRSNSLTLEQEFEEEDRKLDEAICNYFRPIQRSQLDALEARDRANLTPEQTTRYLNMQNEFRNPSWDILDMRVELDYFEELLGE